MHILYITYVYTLNYLYVLSNICKLVIFGRIDTWLQQALELLRVHVPLEPSKSSKVHPKQSFSRAKHSVCRRKKHICKGFYHCNQTSRSGIVLLCL
jgi:hypothetical protein